MKTVPVQTETNGILIRVVRQNGDIAVFAGVDRYKVAEAAVRALPSDLQAEARRDLARLVNGGNAGSALSGYDASGVGWTLEIETVEVLS